MPTIVERANKYAKEESGDNYVAAILRYGGYVKGAQEQHKIDIEKAYEWICDNYADIYNEEINDCKFDEGWRKAFRKAMEE